MAKGQEFTDLLSPGPQRASTWVLLTLAFLLGCIWSSRGSSPLQCLSKKLCLAEALWGYVPARQGLGAWQTQLQFPATLPSPLLARVRKKGLMMLQWPMDMVGWVFR